MQRSTPAPGANEDIVKGYAIDKDTFVEATKEKQEDFAVDSRTIEINEFVEREEIYPRYLIRPYYLRPDGKVGHDAHISLHSTACSEVPNSDMAFGAADAPNEWRCGLPQ